MQATAKLSRERVDLRMTWLRVQRARPPFWLQINLDGAPDACDCSGGSLRARLQLGEAFSIGSITASSGGLQEPHGKRC